MISRYNEINSIDTILTDKRITTVVEHIRLFQSVTVIVGVTNVKGEIQ